MVTKTDRCLTCNHWRQDPEVREWGVCRHIQDDEKAPSNAMAVVDYIDYTIPDHIQDPVIALRTRSGFGCTEWTDRPGEEAQHGN